MLSTLHCGVDRDTVIAMEHTHAGGGPTHDHDIGNGDHVHVVVQRLASGEVVTAWNYPADDPDVRDDPQRFTGGVQLE